MFYAAQSTFLLQLWIKCTWNSKEMLGFVLRISCMGIWRSLWRLIRKQHSDLSSMYTSFHWRTLTYHFSTNINSFLSVKKPPAHQRIKLVFNFIGSTSDIQKELIQTHNLINLLTVYVARRDAHLIDTVCAATLNKLWRRWLLKQLLLRVAPLWRQRYSCSGWCDSVGGLT